MASFKDTIPLALLILCAVSFCHGTQCKLVFRDCGSKEGTLNTAMLFNGTCPEGHAMLKRGTIVSIEFNFQTKKNEATLKSKVYGKIGELPFVPFPLDNPDACKDSGLTCPVAPNTKVNYHPVLDVKKVYPTVNVIVKWILQDASGDNVFCALIPATITD